MTSTQRSESYAFGPYRLDGGERLLLRGSAPVPLTPKVFELLLTLVRRSGHLVEKDELMRAVWPDTYIEESSFTRNVSILRKALGAQQDGSPYIETVTRVGYRFIAPVSQERGEASARSLAVLPFRTIGADAGDESLGFGISDALITRLSNIAEITVRPTSAVMKFAESVSDAAAAGRELAVESVLDGHIQRFGGKLRLTAQFLRVSDGKPLWAEAFETADADLFVLQDSIAEQVAAALELRLTDRQKELLRKRHTVNAEAYRLYEIGRYEIRRFGPGARAFDALRKAIEIDPEYALPHAELGLAYFTHGPYFMDNAEAMRLAQWYIDQALRFDPTLSDARTLTAMFRYWIGYDRVGADQAYRETIALDPNSAIAHHGYGWYLAAVGRFDEAELEIEKAVALDPLSQTLAVDRGLPALFARRYERALAWFDAALRLDPLFWYAHVRAGFVRSCSGDLDGGAGHLQKASQLTGGGYPDIELLAGWTATLAGDRKKGRTVLDRYRNRSGPPWISAYEIAAVHLALDDREAALESLLIACAERDKWLGWLGVDPRFDRLREEPRFREIERIAGFSRQPV
jgi:DNA-binding winged helix-turn-helix (wHTH) protein/tetratricopeptide (TPR) repeat protein